MTRRATDKVTHDRRVAEETLFRTAHAVLHDALVQSDIPQKEVARRLDVSEGRVSQIFSGSENLTLRSFASVAWALGLSLAIIAREAGALGRNDATERADLKPLGSNQVPVSELPVTTREGTEWASPSHAPSSLAA